MKVSIIIAAYNEEKYIGKCLDTLHQQTYKNFEVIVVDDGSKDRTKEIAKGYAGLVLEQNHKGPGNARNFGASKSQGDILVFLDADMWFQKDYIEKIINPILRSETKGTFHTVEKVANIENVWSLCWNIGHKLPIGHRMDFNANSSSVFRAILKSEFVKVQGFDVDGDISDDNLAKKLGYSAAPVKDAICYHNNPETLFEIYRHAVWTGKGKKTSGKPVRNIFFHLFPFSVIRSVIPCIRYKLPHYILYRIIFDFALIIGIFKSKISKNLSE